MKRSIELPYYRARKERMAFGVPYGHTEYYNSSTRQKQNLLLVKMETWHEKKARKIHEWESTENFLMAVSKLPQAEVERDLQVLRKTLPEEKLPSKEEWRKEMVAMRWSNPICGTCRKTKSQGVKLFRCTACHLVHYCR